MNPEQDKQLDNANIPESTGVNNFNSDNLTEPSTELSSPVAGIDHFGSDNQLNDESVTAFGSGPKPVGSETSVSGPSIDKMIAENNQGFIATNQFAEPGRKPKNKKIIIGIIVSVLFALVIGAGSVFALVYNKPENVVGDSFLKLMAAESGSVDMAIISTNKDDKTTINVRSDLNNQLQSHTSVSGDISVMDNKFKLDLSFVTDRFETFYIKADGLVNIYSQFMSLYMGSMLTEPTTSVGEPSSLDSAIEEISNKWIKFSTDDLSPAEQEESKKALKCYESTQQAFRSDEAAQRELGDLLKKYPLFNIESLGTETINDRMANHYKISPVDNIDETSRQLANGLIDTKVFKTLDDCVEQDMAKELKDELKDDTERPSTDDKTSQETSVEYWVDTINHEPLRIKIISSYDQVKAEVVSNIKLNSNPTVQIPTDAITFEEVQDTIIEAMTEQYGEQELMTPIPATSDPVLGMTWLN